MNRNYEISTEESNRIKIFKVWLTIMVLFIHSYSEGVNFATGSINLEMPLWLDVLKYTISQIISRCAVPAFFLISAVLLYKREFNYCNNVIRKVKSLVIPYIIINSLWIVFFYIIQAVPQLSIYFSSDANIVSKWRVYEWLNAYLGFSGEPLCYPLWFLRDLFICNILAKAIKRIIDRLPRIIFCLIVILWIIDIETQIFCMDITAVCFFSLGYYIVKYNIRVNDVMNISKKLILCFYSLLIVIELISHYFNICAVENIVHQVGIVVGILCIFRCATSIKSKKIENVLIRFSSYSFSIYIFHELCLTMLKKVCAIILPQSPIWQLAQYIGIVIVVSIGCMMVSIILKKIAPSIYGAITGNRTI